jgi:multiple sugar transport system ATP-binding protein
MARVELKSVQKSFGDTRVLKGIDLEIPDGEYVVLVGPSGCGKSTLLRCIAGLEAVSGGELTIGDRRVNDVPPQDRDIAMVFQSYALYPHMTVRENLGFALGIRKEAPEAIAEAVGKAARMLELEPLLDRLPGALSGGQRQRVAMGRAIVREPKVFLFDEPLSNLDAALRDHMRVELKRLHRTLGATIVHVTHDQVEALTLADRIVVLHEGVVQQVGTPREVFDTPANTFVATFIGSPAMNLFPGSRGPDGWVPGAEGNVTLGVRPTDVELGTGSLSARVDVIESLGAEAIVHLEMEGGQKLVARVPEPVAAGPGDTVRLSFSRVHVFDLASGQRTS